MASINMKFERFEHKWSGYREILTSAAVSKMLVSKGEKIRQTIEPQIDYDEWDVIVSPRTGRTRARVLVSGVPLWVEKSRAVLGSAIDSARSG